VTLSYNILNHHGLEIEKINPKGVESKWREIENKKVKKIGIIKCSARFI